MNTETMELPASQAPGLTTVDITLTVTRFRNLLEPAAGSAPLTDFIMTGPEEGNGRLKMGDYQKGAPAGARYTLRVQRPGVVLRFTIAARADGERYLPVGIAFERGDGTAPTAVPVVTGNHGKTDTPFSDLEIKGATIQVLDRPLGGVPAKGETTPPRRVTYKFSVFIQRQSDGALGLIDPWIENENAL